MTEMFTALLGEMKSMNENFTAFCSRVEEADGSDREDIDDDPRESASTSGDQTAADDTDETLHQLISSANAASEGATIDSDVLKDIAQDLNVKERTDPAIHEGLAGIFQTRLKGKMSDDKLKTKMEKYVRPENVDLRVPKVNPLVWNQLSSQTRTQDARSQKSQSALIGALIASVKAADLAMKKYSNDRELITLLTDSVAMGLQFNQEVNHSRRAAMKTDLHRDYASLCNMTPVAENSEFLFGDLSKLTKDIAEANKLTKRVRPTSANTRSADRHNRGASGNGSRRFQPYYKHRKSADFFGRDHPSKNKRKKEGKPNHQ